MELIRPAAAVFDLDGTLVDTEPRNRAMWTSLFDAHGVAHDPDLIASFAGQRGYAEGMLAELGIREHFGAVVTADDVITGKPDPEGFLTACARLGAAPERSVGLEDAPAGVAAVKAAGMTCVGVATTLPARALALADRVIADLREVDVLPGPALRVPGG